MNLYELSEVKNMESKLDTLSTVIIVSGIISSIIIAISGLIIFGDLNSSIATAGISGYVLAASLVTAFSLLISTLAIAFSLQAKAEQLDTEKEMLKYCHYINSNIQTLTDAQSAIQQASENNAVKNIGEEKTNSASYINKSSTVLSKEKNVNPSWICKNCKEANPGENKVCSKCGNPKLMNKYY